MKKRIKCLLFAFFAVFMLFSCNTWASTTIKLKRQSAISTRSIVDKKSKKVYAGKSYLIVIPAPATGKQPSGYVKFTARKKKTYTIELSDLQPRTANEYANGHVSFFVPDYQNSLKMVNAKINGKKYNAVYFCVNENYPHDDYFHSAKAKVNLSKGQILYIYFSSYDGKSIKMRIK